MIIRINKKTRISSNNDAWIIQRLMGEEWLNLGYFTSLEGVIHRLESDGILPKEMEEVKEISVRLKYHSSLIEKRLGKMDISAERHPDEVVIGGKWKLKPRVKRFKDDEEIKAILTFDVLKRNENRCWSPEFYCGSLKTTLTKMVWHLAREVVAEDILEIETQLSGLESIFESILGDIEVWDAKAAREGA